MHNLSIERGGREAETFVYGWCPCSWTCEEREGVFADDRIKRAFLDHLKAAAKAGGDRAR